MGASIPMCVWGRGGVGNTHLFNIEIFYSKISPKRVRVIMWSMYDAVYRFGTFTIWTT